MWSWFRPRWKCRSMGRTHPWYGPSAEQLEVRIALAGNVTALVSLGNLLVIGSNQGAAITVSQPLAGKITLSGDGTLINGSSGPVTFSGVMRGLIVNFGSGNDSLTFDETNPITFSGSVVINGGQGSNMISTLESSPGSLNIGGSLTILNLPGLTEFIDLVQLSVTGNVQIQNLGGSAYVSIGAYPADLNPSPTSSIGGSLLISNGAGQFNEVDLTSILVKRNAQITNLSGLSIAGVESTTVGGSLQIVSRSSQRAQTVIGDTKIGQNLAIMGLGAGDSTTLLEAIAINGSTTVQGGDGIDSVFLDDVRCGGSFLLQTGKGADTVWIGALVRTVTVERLVPEWHVNSSGNFVVFKPVYETREVGGGQVTFNGAVTMLLGDGDDTLHLADGAEVTFKKAAILDGMAGNNTASIRSANLPTMPTFMHFQVSQGP